MYKPSKMGFIVALPILHWLIAFLFSGSPGSIKLAAAEA
jgi:hypothetical protein